MKIRIIVLLFIIFVGGISSNAQEKSSQPTFQEESLFYAGKVWGFVKYYHPEARVGKFDMDSLLVVLLDKSAETKNLKERNAVLNGWVSQFGKIKEFEKFIIKDSSQYKQLYDYSWLTNSSFDKKLSKQLLDIKDAKRTDSCYYADLNVIRIPFFDNEKPIEGNLFKVHNRLIILMRYWNIIEYYFPYKYLTDKKWDDVLIEYIPKFLKADNDSDLISAMQSLPTEINDGHAFFKGMNNSPYKKYMSPIELIYSKDRYIVKGFVPYFKNSGNISDYGLEIGDELVSVDGKTPEEIMQSRCGKYMGVSNPNRLYNSLAFFLFQSDTTFINVTYKRNETLIKGRIKTVPFEYKEVVPEPKEKFWITSDSIAYIHVGGINDDEIYEILHKAQKAKGMIIDMRNNRSKSPICAIANSLSAYSLKYVQTTGVLPRHLGIFEIVSDNNDYTGSDMCYYKGKAVVLVDYTTMSEGEFLTMRLQATPYVKTIGSQTAGADGTVTYIPLIKGVKTAFSSIGIYYPDGGETQRVGLRLDEEIYPTPKGIKEGRDEIIERAVDIIRTEKRKVSRYYMTEYKKALNKNKSK